jgi:hypothetical protein
MAFKPVNIRTALIRERGLLAPKEQPVLKAVSRILHAALDRDQTVNERLRAANYNVPEALSLQKYDTARMFSSLEIQALCARYRLRFLDSSAFKPDFPYGAIAEINRFERDNQLSISKFKMLAPPEMFNLEDRCKKDPLLFAQVGEDSFYLLHQWGSDLAWYREVLMWPLKNIYTFAQSLIAVSVLLTFIVPIDWIIRNETHVEQIVYFRIAFFVHTIIFLLAFGLFLGLTFRKNFSEQEWNNPCFN